MREGKERLERPGQIIRYIFWMLILLAVLAGLLSFLILPVFKIYGISMSPTLEKGDVVLAVRDDQIEKGDIIAFSCNNKILVKRVIAVGGEWVDIDDEGTVIVNDEELEEAYLSEKAPGKSDIRLPYQIPDGKFFVMGDNRSESADSRNTKVGCVAQEQIFGKVIFRVWPLGRFGKINEGGF